MKAILFDLGDTLEANGSLVPRALETLSAVQALIDSEGNAPVLGLVSDFTPAATPESVAAMLKEYYAIIGDLAIRPFFEPVAQRVTISTEVGVSKPDEKIFRVALDKILPQLPFQSAAFMTETAGHITDANKLGMRGICVKGGTTPTTWDVDRLADIVPLLREWIKE